MRHEFVRVVKLILLAESFCDINSVLRAHAATLILFRVKLRSHGLPAMVNFDWLSFWSAPRLMWKQKMWEEIWCPRPVSMSLLLIFCSKQLFICSCVVPVWMCLFDCALGSDVWCRGCYWRKNVSDHNYWQSQVSAIVMLAQGEAARRLLIN